MALEDIYAAAAYIPEDRSDLRLDLDGHIEAWTDEMPTGIVGHRILRRAGAIHQQPLLPPRKFVFRGVLLGKDVQQRYLDLADILRAHPIGLFIHPRFSSLQAAVEMLGGDETPSEGIDCVNYQLRIEETGLRDPPRPSSTARAQSAISRSEDLVTLAEEEHPAYMPQAEAVQLGTQGFSQILGQVTSAAALLDLQASLRNLRSLVGDLAGAPYPLRVQAQLVLGDAILGYNEVLGTRPVVTRTIAQATILPRLCAALYGARLAPAMAEEIRGLNRLPPMLIPAGTELLLPDPAAARRGLPTL